MRKSYLYWLMVALLFCNVTNAQLRKSDVLTKQVVLSEKEKDYNALQEKAGFKKVSNEAILYGTSVGKSLTECPGESLYSNPLDGYTSAGNSEAASGLSIATSYFADGSIDSISFWSINAFYDGTAWSSCDNEDPMLFDVVFYEMNGDSVGVQHVLFENLAAVSVATGDTFVTTYPIVMHTVALTEAIDDLPSGYVSIVGKSDNSCSFLWFNSPNGSGQSYQYNSADSTSTVGLPYSICVGGELNSCLAPADLMVSDITPFEATLSWNELGSASNWQVEFSELMAGQVSSTVFNVTDTSLMVENLTELTDYAFTTRAVCAEGDTSVWSSSLGFKTTPDCKVITEYPYTEDFEGDWDTWCWTVIDGDTTGSSWRPEATYMNPVMSGVNAAYVFASVNNYLVTPALAIDQDYQFTWYDKSESAANPNTYQIVVSTTGTEQTDFTDTLGVFVCDGADWEQQAVYLTAYVGETIYVAFHQIDAVSAWYGVGIEDVEVSVAPDCTPVTLLEASNITKTSADLSWFENGSAAAWNVEYGVAGFTPGEGTTVVATANPLAVSDLSAGMYYEFYVQADCGDSQAEWAGPVMFSTACDVSTDLAEGFETAVPPICWSNFANGEGTKVWEQSPTTVSEGEFAAKASYENSGDVNEKWLVTNKTTIPTGKALSFDATDSFGSDYASSLSVLVSTDADATNTDAYTSMLMIAETDVTNGVMSSFSVDLSAYAGQDAYIAFVMMDNDGDSWYLDNVGFISCAAPTGLAAQNVTQTSFEVIWESDASAFAVEYDTAGFTLGDGIADNVDSIGYSVSDLVANTTYDFYVKAICSADDESAWAGPYSITTLKAPADPITEFPYFQGFEGQDEFDQWTPMYNTAADGGLNGANLIAPPTTNSWNVLTPESFSGNGANYIYEGVRSAGLGYSAPDFNWLISPDVVVPAAGLDLEFMIWIKDSVEANWISKFDVLAYNGAEWDILKTFDASTPSNLFEEAVQIALSDYAGTTIKLAYVFEYVDGYELAIDNIELKETVVLSDEAEITAYSFDEETGVATIDSENGTIAIEVVEDTDASALVATFTLSDAAMANIGDDAQESGVTSNDFSSPVVYTVVAEDGTEKEWTVTVSVKVGISQPLAELVNVYPNPTTGNVWVSGSYNAETKATVFDISGKIILTKDLVNAKEELDLNAMEEGLYFIEIVSGSEKAIIKVVKE